MSAPIVLLTDFGLSDPYAAQMKGAILRYIPDAPLVDLSHEVDPRNVLQAGFLLAVTLPHFPPDSLFVAVVDPGVGTNRRILCARMGQGLILAPDNGLLALPLLLRGPPDHPAQVFDCTPAVAELAATGPVSSTFHGRDLFAPLAVRLAQGDPPDTLGPKTALEELFPADLPDLAPADQTSQATILHTDRFGNAVLSLLPEQGAPIPAFTLHQAGQDPKPVRRVAFYADLDPGELGILPGSQGFLELAMNQDSAARRLSLAPGEILTLIRSG